jgi:hypothetical protein
MRALRRGVVIVTLAVTVIVGVAAAASAQVPQPPQPPSNWSPNPVAAVVPDATTNYRIGDQAVEVVVPNTVVVDDAMLRSIEEVIWTSEPVRFRLLEVRHPEQVLHQRYYRDMRRAFGERPAGLEQLSLQELYDGLASAQGFYFGTFFLAIKAIAFAVVGFVVAIMLLVVVMVLVNAQWRRTTGTGASGVSRPGSHPA